MPRSSYTASPPSLAASPTRAGRSSYRQRVVRELVRQERRAAKPEPQRTRAGIAQDYQNAERQRIEQRAIGVAIRLGLR